MTLPTTLHGWIALAMRVGDVLTRLPWWAVIAVTVASGVVTVVGDLVLCVLARRYGPRAFRPGARVLSTENLGASTRFFDQHGPAALVLGRFLPAVRSLLPAAAGACGMTVGAVAAWDAAGVAAQAVLKLVSAALVSRVPALGGSPVLATAVVGAVVGAGGATVGLRRRRAAGGRRRREVTADAAAGADSDEPLAEGA